MEKINGSRFDLSKMNPSLAHDHQSPHHFASGGSQLVNITIKDLTFSYNSHKILDDLNIVVRDAEILSLVGPNGSGKTTLIKCIDRILKPGGSILLDGKEIEEMSRQ
jgi:ABC-type multidrug transport system fused ATPase/permease subunit